MHLKHSRADLADLFYFIFLIAVPSHTFYFLLLITLLRNGSLENILWRKKFTEHTFIEPKAKTSKVVKAVMKENQVIVLGQLPPR